jgi:archaellin
VSNNLRVIDVYGVRNSTTSEIYDFKIHAQLAAGSDAMDLTRLVIRYSDGAVARNYNHSSASLADGGAPQTWFATTWIRGGAAGIDVIRPGDLVEIHLDLYDTTLGERQTASLLLIPESGAPVGLDFRAPNTFSTATLVRLV